MIRKIGAKIFGPRVSPSEVRSSCGKPGKNSGLEEKGVRLPGMGIFFSFARSKKSTGAILPTKIEL
jgi:hypothetical protein